MIRVERYHHFSLYKQFIGVRKTPNTFVNPTTSYNFANPPPPPLSLPPPPSLSRPYFKKAPHTKPFNSGSNFKYNYRHTKEQSSQTGKIDKPSIYYLPPIKDNASTSTSSNTTVYDNLFNELFQNIAGFNIGKRDNEKNGAKHEGSGDGGKVDEKNGDNEKSDKEDIVIQTYEILDGPIETIDDLIRLGRDYKVKYSDKTKRYNLDVKTLSNMIDELTNLNNMIGMRNIKQAVFNKIILTLQGLNNKNLDYNHIVLFGSPGMGKTHVAKLIGAIYSKMGFLSVGNFEQAKLTDLKAGYLGQTELKTQKLLDKCKGSILFIDEAYSLGAEDKIDSFSQAIIDIINPYLDKHKDDFVLIIAGYKDDLNNRFFRGNQGLKSRFGLWLEIDKYTGEDLFKIFKLKVEEYEWSLDKNISTVFFEKHINTFPYFGRDIENFFSKCKIEHAKRVLFLKEEDKKALNMEDIEKGLVLFIHDSSINKAEEENLAMLYSGLYS